MKRKIEFKGKSFFVCSKLFPSFWDSFEKELFEKDNFNILEKYLTKDSVFLDLGAWAGPMTLYASTIAKEVYAFEPDPIIFKELEINVKCNVEVLNNIKIFPTAISIENTSHPLYARTEYGRSSSSLINRAKDKKETIQVQTKTLDRIAANQNINKIDFIKIDIEGSEFKLLPSMKEFLNTYQHPTLLISFHGEYFKEGKLLFKTRSPFFNKILFKINSTLFSNSINKTLSKALTDCFLIMKSYDNIYLSNGENISHSELISNPLNFASSDLVFTNCS